MNTLTAGKSLPDDFNVIIEIGAFSSPVKYEFDKESGMIAVDRFMATAMVYPANYGFIPQTLCDDGDPLDVLVLTPHPLQPGCFVRCRPLGVLDMTDEKGGDSKLLAVPIEKLCPMYAHMQNLNDVPELIREQIRHFFEHYKDLEKGKWVKLEKWHDKEKAQQVIMESVDLYQKEKAEK